MDDYLQNGGKDFHRGRPPPPPAPPEGRVVKNAPCGHSELTSSDQEKVELEDREKQLPSNLFFPSASACAPHENKNGPAVATSLKISPKREKSLLTDRKGAATNKKTRSNPNTLENQRKREAEATSKDATYKAAALKIQAVLGYCTAKKDNLTIDDLDLVYNTFEKFMSSHPVLSRGYIRLFGGTVDPSPAVLMPPLPPQSPRQPTCSQQYGPPPSSQPWSLETLIHLQSMPANLHAVLEGLGRPLSGGPIAQGNDNSVLQADQYKYAAGSPGREELAKSASYRNVAQKNLANTAPPQVGTACITPAAAFLEELLLKFSIHLARQSLAASNQIPSMQGDQSTELAAAALISLLTQRAEQLPPIEAASPAPRPVPVVGVAVQNDSEPPSSSFNGLPRTSHRNLRRMGITSTEELLPGLPDRRPYTRPTGPYQGPPRGRPVGSGRRRRNK